MFWYVEWMNVNKYLLICRFDHQKVSSVMIIVYQLNKLSEQWTGSKLELNG